MISSQNQEKEDYTTTMRAWDEEADAPAHLRQNHPPQNDAGCLAERERLPGAGGDVQPKDFRQVFYGYQPGIEERIRGERPNRNTKKYMTLTLQPLKSFSMAMHLGGDVRLFDIHMESVQKPRPSGGDAQARLQVDGDRSVVNTGNVIAAIIPHTSREMDMQLTAIA